MKRTEFLQTNAFAALGLMSVGQFPTIGTQNDAPLKPFMLPPLPPLEAGPAGTAIRTWVRSTQTNNQFSCVEAAVAPKTMGPPPHVHKDLEVV